MTDKMQLKLTLVALVVLLLSLLAIIGVLANWSTLTLVTTLFVLAYPLSYVAWYVYQRWQNQMLSLISLAQRQCATEQGAMPVPANLTAQLRDAIVKVAHSRSQQALPAELEQVLFQLLAAWQTPVCLFDQQQQLLFRNQAMIEQLKRPLLVGEPASEHGFSQQAGQFSHPDLRQDWSSQTIQFQLNNQRYYLFSAINIAAQLDQHQRQIQQNLVRVLAHELRNSLTPMASMTDTLLAQSKWDDSAVREVLTRILQRSKRLLSFVERYSLLARLPEVNCQWFELKQVVHDCLAMVPAQRIQLQLQGHQQCYADIEQFSQLMINLLKNAVEAVAGSPVTVTISLRVEDQQQVLTIVDDGPGFANLANVLTPFYTTKASGSGIGLAWCNEIVRNHGGKLSVSNTVDQHACISIRLPLAR